MEDIDAHRGKREVRLVGDAWRIGGLLDEVEDLVLLVDMHDAEAGRFHARHFQAANGDIGAGIHMLLKHVFIVHLVDVIAGQDDHVLRIVGLDDIDVLVDGIGRAFVPLRFRDTLRSRQDVEALVAFRPQEAPAALHVADQRMGLVLGCDADAANAGIQRVGKGEVDDAGLAAEIDGRLGTPVGQLLEAASAAARQDIGHGIASQWLIALVVHSAPPLFYTCSSSSMIVARGESVMVVLISPPASTACTRPPLPLPLPP